MIIALILVIAVALIVVYGFWMAGQLGVGASFQPRSPKAPPLSTESANPQARSGRTG